jgi:hypothetical protein
LRVPANESDVADMIMVKVCAVPFYKFAEAATRNFATT